MSWCIMQADARQIPLKDNSVQCVVTSPPYWGLRDYGTATWQGGSDDCDHSKLMGGTGAQNLGKGTAAQIANVERSSVAYRDTCGKCGATRIDSQIGLERTPGEYVEKMVAVFREVKRVLRLDGVCFINLGDSYAGGKQGQASFGDPSSGLNNGKPGVGNKTGERMSVMQRKPPDGLKPKDLVGIPWRVAFALQADGWWLRSDIIWAKPNAMPESVTDRPTKAHEYIFLLSKREKYFFDQDAVREAHLPESIERSQHGWNGNGYRTYPGHPQLRNCQEAMNTCHPNGRNIRTVWNIATQPYPDAHFATFPEDLAERCILAGSSARGCCPECGAPWERVTERSPMEIRRSNRRNEMGLDYANGTPSSGTMIKPPESKTIGWQPTCAHNHEQTKPCIVLDPFGGAGTTLLVADKLNRFGVGLELKKDYCDMAHRRCFNDAPLLAVTE